MLGTKIRERYTLIKQLGSRRFCDTYLAKDEDLPGNHLCVIKQLSPKDLKPLLVQAARQLFILEAKVLYHLGKHDQIPQLFARFKDNQELYLVQEFIDGHELSKEISSSKETKQVRLGEEKVISLLQDILEILSFVHQYKILHRDIKPSNLIRRRKDNKIVLIDFGSVKQIDTQGVNGQGQTKLKIALGTHGYMSPEQAKGHPIFSSDIYSVGIVGIQALTGLFPLPKDPHTHEIIWRHLAQVSPKLADVLDNMVRYDCHQRYQSASEALQALQLLLTDNLQLSNYSLLQQKAGCMTQSKP